MTENKKWLVMLYIAADDVDVINPNDHSLYEECDKMLGKLGRMENDEFHLVALFDAKYNLGNMSQILEKKPGMTFLDDITEEVIVPNIALGSRFHGIYGQREVDTGSRDTLAEFIAWALKKYDDIEYTMLAIIGHGCGWSSSPDDGGFVKGAGSGAGSPSKLGLCPDLTTNNAISTADLGEALRAAGLGEENTTEISRSSGEPVLKKLGRKIDVLFLDACLMGLVEVMYELKDYANFLITGQDYLYAQFPYQNYFNDLSNDTEPIELSRRIIHRYNINRRNVDYQGRITVYNSKESYSDKQLQNKVDLATLIAQPDSGIRNPYKNMNQSTSIKNKRAYLKLIPWVISAVNISLINRLFDPIQNLAFELKNAINHSRELDNLSRSLNRSVEERIRSAYLISQKFNSDTEGSIDFDYESYVDLVDFVINLRDQLSIVENAFKQINKSARKLNKTEEDLLAAVGNARKQCRTIWDVTGQQYRRDYKVINGQLMDITPTLVGITQDIDTNDEEQILPDENGDMVDDNRLIVVSRVMSISNNESFSLDHAHGISIYLPLGRSDVLLNTYRDAQTLKFSEEIPEWGELIALLHGHHFYSAIPSPNVGLQVKRQRP